MVITCLLALIAIALLFGSAVATKFFIFLVGFSLVILGFYFLNNWLASSDFLENGTTCVVNFVRWHRNLPIAIKIAFYMMLFIMILVAFSK